jgi:hypothetical protein
MVLPAAEEIAEPTKPTVSSRATLIRYRAGFSAVASRPRDRT